jgi:hypothetical protein
MKDRTLILLSLVLASIGLFYLISSAAKKRCVLADNPPAPEWKQTMNNMELITAMVTSFALVELRVPTSYDELKNSPFMGVSAEDIINPYSGQPVAVVNEPAPGQMSWVFHDPELTIGFYVYEDGQLHHETFTYSTDYLSMIRQNGSLRQLGRSDQETLLLYRWDLWSDLVDHVLARFATDGGQPSVPESWEQIVEDMPYLAKIRNPFTGGYMQKVESPSPGNFALQVERDAQGAVAGFSVKLFTDQPPGWLYQTFIAPPNID